jgi:hypothetical protein
LIRRLLNLLTALSLLLCVAAGLAWVWSHAATTRWAFNYFGYGEIGFIASGGRFMFYHGHPVRADAGFSGLPEGVPPDSNFSDYRAIEPVVAEWNAGEFGYWRHAATYGVRYRRLFAPAWSVVGLLGVTPVLWARRRWREGESAWRSTHGLCPRCGYDLRATPDKCPECGYAAATTNA